MGHVWFDLEDDERKRGWTFHTWRCARCETHTRRPVRPSDNEVFVIPGTMLAGSCDDLVAALVMSE